MFGIFGQSQQIECHEARHLVQNHNAQLVDVRTIEEVRQGTLPGSIHVPLHAIGQSHSQLDKGKPVIVYCASGARSAQAKAILHNLGFDDVHNLGSLRKYLTC